MNTKKLIMVCMVVTAFVAALELSNLLPGLVTAFLLLGGGCMIAYLLAIDARHRQSENELRFMIKAERSLNSCPSQSVVLKRLQDLVHSDAVVNLAHRQEMVDRLTQCADDAINQHRLYEQDHIHDRAIIKSIINSIDRQQPFFEGHSERVAFTAGLVGSRLNLTREEANALKYGAILHDVGKLTCDGEPENAWGMEHPVRGAAIVPEGEFFTPIREAVWYHHERYDGQGYPEKLLRNDIPFLARIIAVADVYDALVRLGPEEDRLSHAQAVQTIKKATGTLFDPLVVVAFEEVEAEINTFYQ